MSLLFIPLAGKAIEFSSQWAWPLSNRWQQLLSGERAADSRREVPLQFYILYSVATFRSLLLSTLKQFTCIIYHNLPNMWIFVLVLSLKNTRPSSFMYSPLRKNSEFLSLPQVNVSLFLFQLGSLAFPKCLHCWHRALKPFETYSTRSCFDDRAHITTLSVRSLHEIFDLSFIILSLRNRTSSSEGKLTKPNRWRVAVQILPMSLWHCVGLMHKPQIWQFSHSILEK
jgi:hypothetical protein